MRALSILTSLLVSCGAPAVSFPERAEGGLAASRAREVICHVTDSGSVLELEVATNAVPAHLGHGDWFPQPFYADLDGDGYGDAADAIEACEAPSGYVEDASDCDDDDPDANPGIPRSCCSLLFEDDFEAGIAGDGVFGQNGWTNYGASLYNAVYSDAEASQGVLSMYPGTDGGDVARTSPALGESFEFWFNFLDPHDGAAGEQFMVRLITTGGVPSPDNDYFGLSDTTCEGYYCAWTRAGDVELLGPRSAGWHSAEIIVDYDSDTWSACVDGVCSNDLAFAQTFDTLQFLDDNVGVFIDEVGACAP